MQQDPLQQLRDIHLPMEPSWWPPAPGWWLLVALVVAVLFVTTRWLLIRRREQAALREALALQATLDAALSSGRLAPDDYAHACNALLKRTIRRYAPLSGALKLTGTAWLAYLDQVTGSTQYSAGAGTVLGAQRFAPSGQSEDSARLLGQLMPDALRGLYQAAGDGSSDV